MWKNLIFTLVIGVICAAGGGYAGHQAKKLQQAKQFPTQTYIQTRLVDAGYDITIDGVIGKDSRRAWDAYNSTSTK